MSKPYYHKTSLCYFKSGIYFLLILFYFSVFSKLHTAEVRSPYFNMSAVSYNKAGTPKSTLDGSLAPDPGNKLLEYYIA